MPSAHDPLQLGNSANFPRRPIGAVHETLQLRDVAVSAAAGVAVARGGDVTLTIGAAVERDAALPLRRAWEWVRTPKRDLTTLEWAWAGFLAGAVLPKLMEATPVTVQGLAMIVAFALVVGWLQRTE